MSSRASSEAPAGPSHKRPRSDDLRDASPPQQPGVAGPSRASRRSEEPRSSSSGPAFAVEIPYKPCKRPRKRTASPDPRDSDREPSTEEEDSTGRNGGAARTKRCTRSRSALAAVKVDSDDDEEPSTAESDDEPVVASGSRSLPARSSRNAAPVLDLTDSGDEGFSSLSPGLASGSSSRPNPLANNVAPRPRLNIRPGDSLFSTLGAADDDDDDSLVFEDAAAISAKRIDKGKGKARDASTSAVPLADTTTTTNNAAATTADGEALPSLSHLTCPICFGPPAPLALTSCGHAFCAPCLHAALVAGPALTPPPAGTAGAGRGRGGRTGPMGEAARLFNTSTGARGRGRTARSGYAGRASAAATEDEDDEGDPELNKHCPVCRTPLYGGWGKSLRGLVLRMAPVKR
ncbi:Proteophosphoglycan 5 [Rhodotorula toruloides ATCC 204091]|uniref:BY PROTMAP: gi/472585281/gb/EMS22835.1/ zinc finger, RING-type domain containing protein [Rhodosporidium toruloides NP11] gi/647399607/emb/CDR44505.1/ RHTO0S09e05116g1_1 [Rhodosporidium toruloides] n=1 Tax=Rhodotorula toruloides TaxID=5286 RepID=A0A0K3CLH2_RHOTO|nr:Proteophosphoglycan 5 [Rhodotorula toruloides ATCC 204091]KAK4330162.1 zinc finger, RING-type domain containing protein [Rhodotorula toruloides]PRQ71725.1 Proteophosphoglycan 5 [Rhodotorula toruloides]